MIRKFWLLSTALLLLFPMTVLAQSTAFQYDVRGDGGLYSHTPATPAVDWTFLGGPVVDPESEYDVIACDSDSTDTIYAVDLNLPLTLGSIDPVDASFTTVAALSGDIPPDCNAMTIDISTDIAYISDGEGLWTMDLGTGACTLVSAAITAGAPLTQVWELATDGAGNFWAFDVATDSLYDLDETDGSATLLGTFAGDAVFSNNGMDWDPVSSQLIGDVYTGGGTGSYGIWAETGTPGVWAHTEILSHASYPLGDPRVGGPIACYGGTTYQVNFYLDTFVTFATLDPSAGVTTIPQPSQPLPFAMDFDDSGSTLYAVDVNSSDLGTIDLTTGIFSSMMPVVGDWPTDPPTTAVGITCDGSTGQFYLTNTTSLFTLDITTGDTVLVADYQGEMLADDPTTVIEIACNQAGDMFIFSSGDNKLWSVDKTTAVCIELGLGPIPQAGNFIQGMDFDPATGELYASIYVSGGTGYYGTWDTTLGDFTTIETLENLPDPGDGYELKLAIQLVSGPVTVAADTLTVGPGVVAGGDLPELAVSDNMDLRLFRDPLSINAVTQFELTATSPTATPTTFDFTLEGACVSRPNVVQRIQLYNFVTAAYETVDEQNANRAPQPDLTVTVSPTGDLSRFVDPSTREIRAQVRYRADIARASFASNTDHAVWTIE